MADRVVLTSDAIDVGAVSAKVEDDAVGGVVVFVGRVRDHADGRAVTLLEYEAYRPMAIAEMERCIDDVGRAHEGVRLAVTHRVGALKVGEVAVACAAGSAHRGEAFAAAHRLIDEIKARVPIWKREHGPAGAYWVGWKDARCVAGDGDGEAHVHADGHGHGHGHGGADR